MNLKLEIFSALVQFKKIRVWQKGWFTFHSLRWSKMICVWVCVERGWGGDQRVESPDSKVPWWVPFKYNQNQLSSLWRHLSYTRSRSKLCCQYWLWCRKFQNPIVKFTSFEWKYQWTYPVSQNPFSPIFSQKRDWDEGSKRSVLNKRWWNANNEDLGGGWEGNGGGEKIVLCKKLYEWKEGRSN